jgi:hypothetical protein
MIVVKVVNINILYVMFIIEHLIRYIHNLILLCAAKDITACVWHYHPRARSDPV